ncbi:MAG TPA: threonine--tRNA ligase [Candidatus Moranbacteria bacterium]|nr:threonine--tRNA ligase [Candidatus Moranbacteria bacterium]
MKTKQENKKLEIMRHSTSHILAAAVMEMFSGVRFGVGPAIENGFYYDFELPRTLIPEDLPLLEEKMRSIIKANHSFEKQVIPADEAKKRFKQLEQNFKVELIDDLQEEGEKNVLVYKSGNFFDLCSGPHLESTGEVPIDGFKLTKISGAYWKGDEKKPQLQRIYGVAFASKKDLKKHLKLVAEAEKRDHRKLGRELDLFMSHKVAPGMPFFLPKGMTVLKELITFVREESYGSGYNEVRTPQLLNAELWKTSGHWDHYRQDMFHFHHADDKLDIGVKPMNCPAHMLIFKRDLRSYRDLPYRIAETTTLYRNELSGTLAGLTRVRSLSQDDSHIFCTPEQILPEIVALLKKIKRIYQIFDLTIDQIHLSTRPEGFMGEEKDWEVAEQSLKEALQKTKLDYEINEGDGAFYGPKIDVKVKDALGRQWQLATIQLDFQLPSRFEISYINESGETETPVVIHRAILGSMERFMGILIEHYAGAFPLWLSPVQVKVLPVSEKFSEYAEKVVQVLASNNIRVEVDFSDESLGKKIRLAEKEKIPYMLVVGEKEKQEGLVAVRPREDRKKQAVMSLNEFVEKAIREIEERD